MKQQKKPTKQELQIIEYESRIAENKYIKTLVQRRKNAEAEAFLAQQELYDALIRKHQYLINACMQRVTELKGSRKTKDAAK